MQWGGSGDKLDINKFRYPIDKDNSLDAPPIQRLNCITYDTNKGTSTFIAPEDCDFVYLAGPGGYKGGSFEYNGTGETIYAGYAINVNSKLGVYKNVKKGETITFSGADMTKTISFGGYSFIILK